MAIGTAAAACWTNSRAPGNSTESACISSCSRTPFNATSSAIRRSFDGDAAVPGDRAERADVVEAEIARVVLCRRQLDAVVGERLLERLQVQRLTVGDDAVEVEDDRLQRAGHSPGGAFSPARTATFNRFDGGGNGHS